MARTPNFPVKWHAENEARHCWSGYGKQGWSIANHGNHYSLLYDGGVVASAGLTIEAAQWTLDRVGAPMSKKPAIVWC